MAQKGLWNIDKEKCWKTEKPHLQKTEINCGNTKLCMKKTFSAVGCVRVGGRKGVMERWKEEAEQEESRKGQEGERERRGNGRVEIKRVCVNRAFSDFVEDFSPMAEWESDGDLLGFSECASAVSPSVTVVRVVLVSPSIVSGFGENTLADTDCEFVEAQTFFFSLSKKRHPPFVESQEEMNISGTPEKTPPAPRKKIRGIEYGGEHRWLHETEQLLKK